MPDLVEQMYCSQQIFIPPNLPSILKKYAKAAIRTQPGDLLIWSSAYFRALAAGIPPPTKERIEYPPVNTPSGLSPGFLKVLISQIGKGETVSKEVLEERWRGVCLSVQALQDLLAVGMFGDDVHWLEFLAICAGTLQPSLTKTMMQLCELLTEEPEGGNAAIPVSTFLNLYKYLAKLDCGPVNTLEQYEKTLKEDLETQCEAEVMEPHEEEVETGVPNIDWDTAIGDDTTQAEESGVEQDDTTQAEKSGVEHTESTDNVDETANPDANVEASSKDVEEHTVTVDAEDGVVTVDTEEIATEESNQEVKSEDVTYEVADATEGTKNEVTELNASGSDNIEAETDEREKPAEGGLDETKDEPLVDAEEDAADGDSEGGSNGGDSGVATADESQDPKGAVKDDIPGNELNDELTEEAPDKNGKDDSVPDQITPEQQIVEVVDKITSNDSSAVPVERTDSEGENDGTVEVVEGDNSSPEKPSKNDDPDQPEESQDEPQSEVPPDPAEESIIAENQDGSPGETNDPEAANTGETVLTDSANDNETTKGLPVAQTEDETSPPTVAEGDSTVEPTVESAVESNDDVPDEANEDEPVATDTNDESQGEAVPDEAKADEANPEEPQKTEPMLNIGSVYIIDDDGTLSAAPRPVSASDDGDLQERDSDKTIATNPSDDGMMVWPEIKPEKEEVEVEPQMEKEVTSEDGIEVFTEVDVEPTQEEIKMLPEKSEENQPEAAGNEENIFAPQIDSFTDLMEAESAPAEEFSPEELAAAEGSAEYFGDEASRQVVLEKAASVQVSETPTWNVTQSTEPTQLEPVDDPLKTKSEPKSQKDADIESLVKKDSEMILLPTPVTSDIMLYVDNECEKSSQKVSPTRQLSNKMSLVDVQVAVPIDETVVEVVERHRYPKWMNIPGIGPIVPDHIVEEAEKYFLTVSELQEGMVMPRNIRHFHCPPLEMNPECVEEDRNWSITSRTQ